MRTIVVLVERALLITLSLVSGCRRAPPTPSAPTTVDVASPATAAHSAPSVDAAASHASRPPCDVVHEANARALKDAPTLPAMGCDCGFHPDAYVDLCAQSGDEAWGVVLGVPSITARAPTGEAVEIAGTWRIVHVDNEGTMVDAAEQSLRVSVGDATRFDLATFDYDGDGRVELLLTRTSRESHYEHTTGVVWTFASGSIARYDRAPEFGATEDVDGDGRPDLRVDGPFGDDPAACYPSPRIILAHSLRDGGFDITDDVARAASLSSCGREQRVGPDRVSPDGVVCARLAGESSAALLAKIHTVCPQAPPDLCNVLGPCARYDLSLRFAMAPCDPHLCKSP
jgi:hypothetical protein